MPDPRATWLFPLDPPFPERIYAGTKVWEFRKGRHYKIAPGDQVFLWENGTGSTTGGFLVADVVHGSAAGLLALAMDEETHVSARGYLKDCKRGTALRIANPRRFVQARSLQDLDRASHPQAPIRLGQLPAEFG